VPVEEEVRKGGMAQGYAKTLKHRALMEKMQNGIKSRGEFFVYIVTKFII
jgi:hypothetical protein